MRTVRTLLVLPVLLLVLCSCGLFFASPFPVLLAQTMAQRDFSADIDLLAPDRFQPYAIERGSDRLVVLVGGYPYPVDKPWLFILRSDLSLITSYTLAELTALAGGSFSGTGAAVDACGYLIVGNVQFDIVDADTVIPFSVPAGDVGNRGGIGSPTAYTMPGSHNVCHFGASSASLQWDVYDCSWNFVSSPVVPIHPTVPGFWLRALFAEPYPSAGDVVLALEENEPNAEGKWVTWFVRIPRASFDGTITPNFLDGVSYPSFTKTSIDSSSMGLTADGIVAYSYATQDYILFSFDDPDTLTTLHAGRIDDEKDSLRTSWSWSGGYSCVYDTRTKILSKVATWWN